MALDGVTNTEKILECFFMLSDAFCGSLLKTSCENISQKKFLFSPKKNKNEATCNNLKFYFREKKPRKLQRSLRLISPRRS